ncbi:hypothetical protein K443DRAFT_682436 [Laccaria amethystina LaAM-08-1]|uniref:Uncharacterized protein n=1 Tax=Laccaria amethystina LaAM-08-1 TaxID=1095629 RepID=A0A0C9XF13_9AGAR|nr:hypothetical protein K443DRAFT_682436 [Laccaria amethystina LaAM-08-1]
MGLEGKFFLKEGEDAASRPIPNAIHLVRRGNFLLSILRKHDKKLRSYESSVRNKGQLKVLASLDSLGPWRRRLLIAVSSNGEPRVRPWLLSMTAAFHVLYMTADAGGKSLKCH